MHAGKRRKCCGRGRIFIVRSVKLIFALLMVYISSSLRNFAWYKYAIEGLRHPGNFRILSSLGKASGYDMDDLGILVPPKEVCGMKVIDRKLFSKTITVPWIVIPLGLENKVSLYSKCLKKYMLKLERLKPMQDIDDPTTDNSSVSLSETPVRRKLVSTAEAPKKRILLNPTIVKTYGDINDIDRSYLKELGISEDHFNCGDITLTYDNWKAEEIIKSVIPPGVGNLSSFSKIGHIVHVNLKENLLDYKNIIGQVLFDKVPGVRTVVNKTDAIDSTYRNFHMEVLCGENDMKAQVRENRCVFEFDFSHVYWNPRLCTEHERIISRLSPGDTLFDVFAGVGPFSVPGARHRRCALVLANDLNPESYRWLVHNASLNKVPPSIFHAFNKDGWSFITEDVARGIEKRWKGSLEGSQGVSGRMHVVMNLPGRAAEFLGAFRGLFDGKECFRTIARKDLIHVHVYCFAVVENSHDEAVTLVESNLGVRLQSKEVTFVRKVSPTKEMLRVTFELPDEVLFASSREPSPLPPSKRICLEEAGEEFG